MDNFMLHVQELGKPNNLFICTNNRTWKNVVYSQVLCSSKNIYIYIYLNSQVGHRDTTTMAGNNMACNDLRAWGALGRDALPSPPPNSYISIYIKISCLCVCRVTSGVSTDVIVKIELYASWNCVSTDVMFVNWWNYRQGHKWRPRHRDTGNIKDDRGTMTHH